MTQKTASGTGIASPKFALIHTTRTLVMMVFFATDCVASVARRKSCTCHIVIVLNHIVPPILGQLCPDIAAMPIHYDEIT